MEETATPQFLAQPETQQPAMEETAAPQFLAQPETQQPAMEETATPQFLAQPETQQPAMEEKLSDPQCQNDEGGESAAESHCVGLETPSNSRSEAISSSRQSQPPAVEADRTSSGSDCKQPDTGDYISLESSPKDESSPYFLKGRNDPEECSSLKCEVEPVVDNVVANPVSSCVRESEGDQMSSKQNHTEVAHIESVLKMLDCGTSSVTSRGIEKVDPTHGPSLATGQSESDGSDSESSSESSDDSMGLEQELKENGHISDEEGERTRNSRHGYPMSKGEISYKDLPPVDECNTAFPENGRLLPIGKVSHYSEKLVVIESLEGTPPVNEGTVLWSEDRRALAMVFEIFGPVKKPYYSVRVNSQDHGHTLGLSPGAVLYVVPASLELTHYVFTRELINQKGSDASWKDDSEVPTELQDYSDDEEQRVAGKKHGKGGRSRGGRPAPSVTRHSPTVSGSAMQPHSVGGGQSLQPVRPHPWHAHRPAQPRASGMHAGFSPPPYPTHVQQPPVNYPPRHPLIGGMPHQLQPSAHYQGNPLLHIPTSGMGPPANNEEHLDYFY